MSFSKEADSSGSIEHGILMSCQLKKKNILYLFTFHQITGVHADLTHLSASAAVFYNVIELSSRLKQTLA